MNICSDSHEEIVYDSKQCPLCESKNEIFNLQEKIESLEKQIENLGHE